MPDTRAHRGPHPDDLRLFAPDALSRLRGAVTDLSWLLTRGYAQPSALKLVGDRFGLDARQRHAVARSACSDQALAARTARRVSPADVVGRTVLIDGYNVQTTVEVALGGGVVLIGRDGCCRDIAGVHGTHRRVAETLPALALIARTIERLRIGRARWLLDSPVSNSGRLRQMILRAAAPAAEGLTLDWEVDLVPDVDAVLGSSSSSSDGVIATADSVVLDRASGCGWLNLAAEVIRRHGPGTFIIDLSDPAISAGADRTED